MSKQAYEQKLEALKAVRSAPDAVPQLRRALKDRNNYYVSKAAALAAELDARNLIPDLAAAFDRFLSDPVKSDPKCWAKIAIAKALRDLEHDDPDVFLRGISLVQLEPVWGRREDSAAPLRGICGLALVNCRLADFEVLRRLVDLLADPEKPARIDAVRAIWQVGGPEAVLLLRLKALTGDREPEVAGECFDALLSLEPRDSVSFVSRFLDSGDEDVRIEAVAALGQSREPEAVEALKKFWRGRITPETRQSLLMSLAASPLREAEEFLLSVLADASGELAATAVAALAASRFRDDVRERVAQAVAAKGEPELTRAFEKEFAK